MNIRIVKHMFDDGVTREILEYRKHWWSKWRPLYNDGEFSVVSYISQNTSKSAEESGFDMLGLDNKQRWVRYRMSCYIRNAEEIYVGARVGEDWYVAYDADDGTLETLRNLE